MANGTVLGSPTTPQFPTQVFYYAAPLLAQTLAEFNIISAGFGQLGIAVSYAPGAYPFSPYPNLGWIADWTDPYYQLIQPAFSTVDGLPSNVDVSSVNATLARIINDLPYLTSPSTQVAYTQQIYKFMRGYAPYAWMPDPDNTYFVQPYVRGFFYNPIAFYSYDSISYGSAPNCPSVPNRGGANLQGAYLAYCNFAGYNLAGDNLQNANLTGANLQGANLKGANLQGAALDQANAQGASYQGANMQSAGLAHGNFANVNFQGTNMQNSDMSYGDFNYANFQGANTQGARITGATFVGAVDPP